MLKYYEGTVFNANTEAIVNTVNCEGIMGAGLAQEFRLRYPAMYLDYKQKTSVGSIEPCKVSYYHDSSGITIVNFPTKDSFRHPSRIEWIEGGLEHFIATYKQHNFTSVAFPKLGTGYGGLAWEVVQPKMEIYLGRLDIKIVICMDQSADVAGKEREMLDWFNSQDMIKFGREIGLNKAQIDALCLSAPVFRFRALQNIRSIGPRTFEKIFRHVYCQVTQKPGRGNQQGKLF